VGIGFECFLWWWTGRLMARFSAARRPINVRPVDGHCHQAEKQSRVVSGRQLDSKVQPADRCGGLVENEVGTHTQKHGQLKCKSTAKTMAGALVHISALKMKRKVRIVEQLPSWRPEKINWKMFRPLCCYLVCYMMITVAAVAIAIETARCKSSFSS